MLAIKASVLVVFVLSIEKLNAQTMMLEAMATKHDDRSIRKTLLTQYFICPSYNSKI